MVVQTRALPQSGETFTRDFEIDSNAIDIQARTVELSFSSEAPVERWFGTEILDHGPGAVRMARINNGGPLLLGHDLDDQIGVTVTASINSKTKRGKATVRFSRSAHAEEIFQDVIDGIRRLVSVGYRIFKTVTETNGGVETVRAVDWEPYEISIVPVPADDSVGVGRSDSNPANHNPNSTSFMNRAQLIAALRARGISFSDSATDAELQGLLNRSLATDPVDPPTPADPPTPPNRGPPAEPVTGQRNLATNPTAVVVSEAPPAPSGDYTSHANRAIAAERQRCADIRTTADALTRNGITMDAQRAINDGVSAAEFQRQAFEALTTRQTSYAPGRVSEGERRDLDRFSIVRGLGLLMQGRALDGIEGELQVEAQNEARASGINLEGNFHIPSIVLNHGRRDMTATGTTSTTGDQGGTTIQTNLGSFIELLYARLVLRGLGAQVLTGLVGNIDLPRFVTGATVANATENATATESNPTTGLLSLRPHRATTFVEVSQQLMTQSSQSVEGLVRNDLLTALALLMEARAINGSGSSNQPLGILGTSGIGSVVGGTNGAAPDWSHIVALETAVATSNADIGSLGYLTNTKVRGTLKNTAKMGNTTGLAVWGEGSTPLNGYGAAVTTQVPSGLTKGTASGNCSAIIFGNFSDLILAQWGGISIMANPYIKDTEGLVRLTINAYHDNIARRPASFSAMLDALAG